MSSPRPEMRRRDKDLLKLVQSNHKVTMVEGSHQFCVRFYGPIKTLYEGGIWNVRVYLPDDYPFKSPSVAFVNRVYHPNIDVISGAVCLNVLNQAWTPVFDLFNIFEAFLPQLLAYPNPDDPLNKAAAMLYLRSQDEYKRVVKYFVNKYATEQVLKGLEPSSSGSDSSQSTLSDN